MPEITLTVTRDERDLILHELWRWANDVDPVKFNTREQAAHAIAALQRAARAKDELAGWDGEEEPTQQTFAVTADAALVELLQDVAADASHELPRERSSRERAQAGDRGHWFTAYDNLEDVLAEFDRLIRGYEQQIAICDDLLARIARGTGDARAVVA